MKIDIKNIQAPTPKFRDLQPGDVFSVRRYDNLYSRTCMKTDHIDYRTMGEDAESYIIINAVNLANGELLYVKDDDPVLPVNATLVGI